MVFAVVLSGQLLAIVITLVSGGHSGDTLWLRLGLVSVFIQWNGLSSAAVLCVSRRWLQRLGDAQAGVMSYVIVLAVCAVMTELAYWMVEQRLIITQSASWASAATPAALTAPDHLEFLLRNLAIAAIMAAAILRYLYVQHQWKRRVESEARARIQALQSRIRPHFLFNSMNTIASLARSQPAVAEQVTEDLAELFRESLSDAGVPTTLGRELEICRQYLRIEEQRLGERLQTRWQVDDLPGQALIPRLTLQPLLENAVYHGIEPAADGGEVQLTGECTDERVTITLRNTLPASGAEPARQGNQLAQANVVERLGAFFEDRAKVGVAVDAGTYAVTLEFPIVTQASG